MTISKTRTIRNVVLKATVLGALAAVSQQESAVEVDGLKMWWTTGSSSAAGKYAPVKRQGSFAPSGAVMPESEPGGPFSLQGTVSSSTWNPMMGLGLWSNDKEAEIERLKGFKIHQAKRPEEVVTSERGGKAGRGSQVMKLLSDFACPGNFGSSCDGALKKRVASMVNMDPGKVRKQLEFPPFAGASSSLVSNAALGIGEKLGTDENGDQEGYFDEDEADNEELLNFLQKAIDAEKHPSGKLRIEGATPVVSEVSSTTSGGDSSGTPRSQTESPRFESLWLEALKKLMEPGATTEGIGVDGGSTSGSAGTAEVMDEVTDIKELREQIQVLRDRMRQFENEEDKKLAELGGEREKVAGEREYWRNGQRKRTEAKKEALEVLRAKLEVYRDQDFEKFMEDLETKDKDEINPFAVRSSLVDEMGNHSLVDEMGNHFDGDGAAGLYETIEDEGVDPANSDSEDGMDDIFKHETHKMVQRLEEDIEDSDDDEGPSGEEPSWLVDASQHHTYLKAKWYNNERVQGQQVHTGQAQGVPSGPTRNGSKPKGGRRSKLGRRKADRDNVPIGGPPEDESVTDQERGAEKFGQLAYAMDSTWELRDEGGDYDDGVSNESAEEIESDEEEFRPPVSSSVHSQLKTLPAAQGKPSSKQRRRRGRKAGSDELTHQDSEALHEMLTMSVGRSTIAVPSTQAVPSLTAENFPPLAKKVLGEIGQVKESLGKGPVGDQAEGEAAANFKKAVEQIEKELREALEKPSTAGDRIDALIEKYGEEARKFDEDRKRKWAYQFVTAEAPVGDLQVTTARVDHGQEPTECGLWQSMCTAFQQGAGNAKGKAFETQLTQDNTWTFKNACLNTSRGCGFLVGGTQQLWNTCMSTVRTGLRGASKRCEAFLNTLRTCGSSCFNINRAPPVTAAGVETAWS